MSPPEMTGDEALALLRRGESAYDAGRLDEAKRAFEALIPTGMLGEWAQFFLGRVWRDLDRGEQALRAFDAAIAIAPGMFWAHYERLVLMHERGARAIELVSPVEAMVPLEWERLDAVHVQTLEPIAHVLWDDGRVAAAAALLGKLWPAELGRLSLVRLVERAPDRKVAAAAAERLENAPELDANALRVLSDHHAQKGDLDREILTLHKRRRLAPKDFQTWLGLVRALARKGERERTVAALADADGFAPRQRSFVQLIADLELGDVDSAFLSLRTHARLWEEVPKFPGIRLAYLLGDQFDAVRRDEVLALLRSQHDADPDVALVQVNAAMRDQRWEEARALFERHFAGLENKTQAMRLTQIDVLAFSGRSEEAVALLQAERVDGVVQPAFLRSTLRIMSELDRWDDAFEAGLANLGQDASFEHFLSAMVRAGRKTGRTAELLDGLLALPRPLKQTQLDALHAVGEDLAEQGDGGVLDRIGDLPVPQERLHRIRLKLRSAAARPAEPAKDLCIYYCADGDYLTPALVSLTALAMSNSSVARRADFRLVVDKDAVEPAREGGEAIARRLGIALEVVDASGVVSSADRLRTAYGLFTGGQSLSLAAYYRIFYARHLLDTGEYAQAFYVDADTIVRGGLDELFEMEMAEPVWARPETDRPEVRHATSVHGLKRKYFNSGVLRFDLRHPELGAALDRAIAAALDPEVRLIFQDQCALNIGFDGMAGELPDRFNYFNPPSVSGDSVSASDAVVVHFLDRPKPWDGLYRRRAREWFEWYDLIQTLRTDAGG